MYPVSGLFQMEMKIARLIESESVYGTLYLRTADGIISYNFDESAVVQGSLVIKDQLGDGKFGYGGAYIRNLSIRIDCDKIDGLNAMNVNLTNAEIEIWYRLYLNSKDYEDVYMGRFYLDGRNSSRKFQMLKLIGEDCLSKFDVMSVALSGASPYEVYATACSLAGIIPFTPEEEVDAFPNGGLSLTFDTSQIQTARDMLMWVAKLTGTIARVKRQSEPAVELVQIPTKYTTYNIPGLFDLDAFQEDNGSIIGKDSTFNTEYTDTSIRTLTLITDYKGVRLVDGWHYTPEIPHGADLLEGTMEIESNPLLNGKTENEVKAALGALQNYTEHLRMTPFKITFTGNPAIEIGDFVYLESGGVILDAFRHYGVVTYHRWVFRGISEIRCEYGGTSHRPYYLKGDEPEAATFAAALSEETASVESVQPKSQLEKKLESNTSNSASATIPEKLHAQGSETTITTDVFDLKIGVTGNNPNRPADNYVTVGTNSGYGINIKNFLNGSQLCAIELDDLYFNVYGENQKNILKAELNGESFSIGAFKFTFNTDGVYIYNTVKKRGISIAYTN